MTLTPAARKTWASWLTSSPAEKRKMKSASRCAPVTPWSSRWGIDQGPGQNRQSQRGLHGGRRHRERSRSHLHAGGPLSILINLSPHDQRPSCHEFTSLRRHSSRCKDWSRLPDWALLCNRSECFPWRWLQKLHSHVVIDGHTTLGRGERDLSVREHWIENTGLEVERRHHVYGDWRLQYDSRIRDCPQWNRRWRVHHHRSPHEQPAGLLLLKPPIT